MKAVLQRVLWARVEVEEKTVGAVGKGFCVLLGVTHDDERKDVDWLAEKVANLRVFEDGEGKLNLSLADVRGEVLVVSQFTLYGDCRKGRRPSFVDAAAPEHARRLYEQFVDALRERGLRVETGVFQATMQVSLCNDGPVTMIIESRGA